MTDSKTHALRKVPVPEPWPPAEATDRFRAMVQQVQDQVFDIALRLHAEDQMVLRDIYMPDVLHAIKHGFVYGDPEPTDRPGLYRYTVRGPTPNHGTRDIKVVLIPSMHKSFAKIVTVMWADEVTARG
jgi:hypothetical protein